MFAKERSQKRDLESRLRQKANANLSFVVYKLIHKSSKMYKFAVYLPSYSTPRGKNRVMLELSIVLSLGKLIYIQPLYTGRRSRSDLPLVKALH